MRLTCLKWLKSTWHWHSNAFNANGRTMNYVIDADRCHTPYRTQLVRLPNTRSRSDEGVNKHSRDGEGFVTRKKQNLKSTTRRIQEKRNWKDIFTGNSRINLKKVWKGFDSRFCQLLSTRKETRPETQSQRTNRTTWSQRTNRTNRSQRTNRTMPNVTPIQHPILPPEWERPTWLLDQMNNQRSHNAITPLSLTAWPWPHCLTDCSTYCSTYSRPLEHELQLLNARCWILKRWTPSNLSP